VRDARIRPKTRRTLRALGGRRIVVEGFGRRAPSFVSIAGGSDVPVGAWLSPGELRRLADVARRILK
jgi:hypothetical protein